MNDNNEISYTLPIQDDVTIDGETYNAIEQIGASVYEVQDRAVKTGKAVMILLDHAESPTRINGRSQATPRRPDGGYRWYHGPEASKCYMRAMPQNPNVFNRDHAQLQQDWADHIQDVLHDIGYEANDLIYERGEADIYMEAQDTTAGAREQIVGLSLQNSKDARIERACWYEDDTFSAEFNRLLEEDGIRPDDFQDSIVAVSPSLFEYLEQTLDAETVEPETFLSGKHLETARDLQVPDHRGENISCVLGPLYPYDA